MYRVSPGIFDRVVHESRIPKRQGPPSQRLHRRRQSAFFSIGTHFPPRQNPFALFERPFGEKPHGTRQQHTAHAGRQQSQGQGQLFPGGERKEGKRRRKKKRVRMTPPRFLFASAFLLTSDAVCTPVRRGPEPLPASTDRFCAAKAETLSSGPRNPKPTKKKKKKKKRKKRKKKKKKKKGEEEWAGKCRPESPKACCNLASTERRSAERCRRCRARPKTAAAATAPPRRKMRPDRTTLRRMKILSFSYYFFHLLSIPNVSNS